ncbi:MAG: sodium/glutamate symporter [Pseudomonadota bacterium]
MEPAAGPGPIEIDAFAALTLGIVVYFAGERLTNRFPVLARYSIPEPVSGGLAAALMALAVVLLTGRQVTYDLTARDALLVYFFTTVGLNARLSDLLKGGPILGILLALTLGFMVVQTLVGAVGATLFGLPVAGSVMLGTASLIGGHGTAIAWGPVVQHTYGVAGAAELGIASATVGLILASLLGGPVAGFLVKRHKLAEALSDTKTSLEAPPPVADGAGSGKADRTVEHGDFMSAVLWIHVAMIVGIALHEALEEVGLMLPVFVPCLLSGILLTNTIPAAFPRLDWPSHTPALSLVAGFSLSVFLSMSLMSMELWTLASSAAVLAFTMALQTAATAAFVILIVFRAMGRDYTAAVLSAGFAGFALGATPTAIANMNAVTQRYGPAPLAFIVLPLVSAFFVDLANAFLIQTFLSL